MGHGFNDSIAEIVRARAREMAETLANADPDGLSDAIYDLRGTVLEALKEADYLPPDAAGPDHQAVIDAVIRRLLEDI